MLWDEWPEHSDLIEPKRDIVTNGASQDRLPRKKPFSLFTPKLLENLRNRRVLNSRKKLLLPQG